MVVGGHAWLQGGMHGCWGACVVVGACLVGGGMHGCRGCAWLQGGMHGCWGACMVGGCAWLWGCVWLPGACVVGEACVVAGGGACMVGGCVVAGGHAWLLGGVRRIRRDTVNERAIRILLECILVKHFFSCLTKLHYGFKTGLHLNFRVFSPHNVRLVIKKLRELKFRVL